MIASVHIADLGGIGPLLLRPPSAKTVPGLRTAQAGVTASFTEKILPKPMFRRAACVCFWDDDDSLTEFLSSGGRTATALNAGVTIRMAPIRAYGAWPGLPVETAKQRSVGDDAEGPVVVLTLGQLKPWRLPEFLKASAMAEGGLAQADGVLWAMGLTQLPRFVGTISLWESSAAIQDYAYGAGGHADAMAVRQKNGFHTTEAFVRFRPYSSTGELTQLPALASGWLGPS